MEEDIFGTDTWLLEEELPFPSLMTWRQDFDCQEMIILFCLNVGVSEPKPKQHTRLEASGGQERWQD